MDAPATRADDDAQPQHADVYERLYDVRSYTGVYRKRFELDIHDLTDTVVHDLAGTVRTNLNHDVENRPRRPTLSPRLSTSSINAAAAAAAMAIDTHAPRQSPERPVPCPSPIRLEGDPNDPHTLLRAVFHYYCRFGRTGSKGANETSMDNANFSKLCRECPELLDASFTRTDVDLIFVKSKKKGERRINYTRFLDALGMIAIQKYPELSLAASVPKLLQDHISKLPCIVEFTDGKQVQAVWSRRLDRSDSQSSTSSSAPPSPPSRRSSTPHASPPKASTPSPVMPSAVPSRSPRLHRRLSSPPSPPTTVVGDRELRRSKSEDDQCRVSPSKPSAMALVLTAASTAPNPVTATITAIQEIREGDDDDEEESLCFAS